MKIHISKLKPVILDWLDEVVMPKSVGLQKFILVFSTLQMKNQIDEYLNKAAIFADKDGYLDLEFTKENASTALEKAGGYITLPYINWNFDKDDLDKLFSLAQRYAK